MKYKWLVFSFLIILISSPCFAGMGDEVYSPLADDGNILTTTRDLSIEADCSIRGNLTVDGGTLYVDSGADRVGIGTTSPDAKLEVNGDLSLGDALTVFGNRNVDGLIRYDVRVSNPTAGTAVTIDYFGSESFPFGFEVTNMRMHRDLTHSVDVTLNAVEGYWDLEGWNTSSTINQITLSNTEFEESDVSITDSTVAANATLAVNVGLPVTGGYNFIIEGYKK